VSPEDFVGRQAEARVILTNVEHGHNSLVIGEAGVGKTALLRFIEPVLASMGPYVATVRVGPGFGSFLRELYTGLWDVGLVPDRTQQLPNDLKAWGKACPNNDEKARWLLELMEQHEGVIASIDDAQGISPSNRPWLERLTEVATVIGAVDPSALKKTGTKRFWKRFDEVRLGPLSASESAELLEKLVERYRVRADEPEIYRRRVLELAQGNPFELERLVKHHSADALVKARELGHYGEGFVERDVKQVALAPVLIAASGLTIAARYVARAQGNLDLYVLSGVGIAVSMLLLPAVRASLRPRSRS